MSRIGAHVSAAGSVDSAPLNAERLGCEVFQFFSRSPRGGRAKEITPAIAENFKNTCSAKKMEGYIHAPYYINFASNNNRISFGSVSVIREELQRGTQLGVPYIMTHLGSAKDLGDRDAIKQTISRIKSIYEKEENWTTKLLLENSAGAQDVVGDNFEELATIIKEVGREDIGICLDTCHLFASGYAINTEAGFKKTIEEFKKQMPLELIRLFHANDSMVKLGERKDRHADIGSGHIGLEPFGFLMKHSAFKNVNLILETPGGDERQKEDIQTMKTLRDSGK